MTNLVKDLRKLLKENNADALLVNSTNEFLVEYNQLSYSSRYKLTGFSGSVGDALLTKDKIYQFVDARYHEQADLEVNRSLVDVVKLQIGDSYLQKLAENIPENSTLLIVGTKISRHFYGTLATKLEEKSVKIKTLDSDFVLNSDFSQYKNIVFVPKSIAGIAANDKIERIQKKLKNDEFIIVTSLEDIAYLTNLRSFDIPYSSFYYAKMIISKGKAYLFTDYEVQKEYERLKIKPLPAFKNRLGNLKGSTLYIDSKTITISDFEAIDTSNILKESKIYLLKSKKNTAEINHIKSAFERTDKALAVVKNMLKEEEKIYSEYEIAEALEASFYKNGATALSFKPIVAAGSNSSIIHYSAPSKEVFVKNGDLLLVDCGAYYEGGYATDITRTFIKGTPSKAQKIIYTTVLKAFFSAYKGTYKKNANWFDIDKNARATINKIDNIGYSFAHSTGHGVGISVHEMPPAVSPSDISKTKIFKNAVFTIEPGIYKTGEGGVRLENTVYIKDIAGNIDIETLSKFKFEEKLIDYDILNTKEQKWLKDWQAMNE